MYLSDLNAQQREPPLNRTNIFFGESHSDWLPVRGGESGDFVFRRGDGHAFAKIAPASRRGELAGERDRLIWLKGRGVACPEVIGTGGCMLGDNGNSGSTGG